MRISYFLFIFFLHFSLTGMLAVFGQDAGIYSKGTWSYDVNQGFSAKFLSDKQDGDKYGNTVLTSVNLWALYFPVDHFAVGLWYDQNGSREKNTKYNTIHKYYSNMGYLELMYGRSFGNFNLQAWGAGGIGQARYKVGENGNSNNCKLFKWMICLESPFMMASNCDGFITPGISYESGKGKWDGGDDKDNYFDIYLNLMFFVPTHDYYCDIGQGCSTVSERYHQGYASLGVSTWIDISFGNYKSHGEDETGNRIVTTDRYENEFRGAVNGYYYVIDNLAVGLRLNLDTYHYRGKNDSPSSLDQSGTEFTFMPQVMYNLPFKGCIKNLFVNAGFGLGVDNWRHALSLYKNDWKDRITQYYAGAGYNCFFTDNFAFSPQLGFESQTYKSNIPNGPDTKHTQSGLAIDIGLDYFFGGMQSFRYH